MHETVQRAAVKQCENQYGSSLSLSFHQPQTFTDFVRMLLIWTTLTFSNCTVVSGALVRKILGWMGVSLITEAVSKAGQKCTPRFVTLTISSRQHVPVSLLARQYPGMPAFKTLFPA